MDLFTEDYELLAAHNGTTALALLAQRPVALVITDLRMPDMDGVTLAAAIKAHAPQCPIILMTGYPSPEIKQRADAAGVEYFLPKPFGIDQLAALVRLALRQ
jgi:CheY-like chemotaxis protein